MKDYQKPLKKSTLIFLPNPVPFNVQSYQKQKGPGTSDQSLLRLQNMFRKIPLLAIYCLTKFDDVTQCSCWVIQKNYICKFMQIKSWHHKLFYFYLSFCIWKKLKGKEKITKIWISQERKELFRLHKKYLPQFLEGYRLVKK